MAETGWWGERGVHAELVCASGDGFEEDACAVGFVGEDGVAGLGGLAEVGVVDLEGTCAGVEADGGGDEALG